MEFGIFDHLDRSGPDLATFYENRLRLIEEYDRLGFHAWFVAEHHGTPLGMAPVPGVFLSAVAQRTRRLRFGSLVYVLPLHHPIRLIEEVCMLDQLSSGRFQLGIGRGISSHLENRLYGVAQEEITARYQEGAAILLTGLRDGVVNHDGAVYHFSDVPFHVAPFQKPHPPIWYGAGHPESCVWAAEHDVNIISNAPVATTRAITDRYRAEWARLGRQEPLPFLGMNRHIVVADTDAEARAIARRAYACWRESFLHIWRRFNATPGAIYAEDFDTLAASGAGIAGSPTTVANWLREQCGAAGVNFLCTRLCFGDMTLQEATHSATLFMQQVAPSLRELVPATA